ncbi:LysR family transcriptional regulator [Achromobacter insolitus]|jgi:DNA-binding transcriptional LysR family regulator|uniref:HTH-type transcriptional regulator GltC n=1 Tax=Achromobacter insolitus TaxID=217204 RepID=A0A6S7EVH0_9BURK|nr:MULTISPECIES: LysR family transcriptional regulator [Achromobacter]APX74268.1 LysR family transcriptional regulator [Achromobacter insolitus]AXA69805.1 LysR family transcriptional regulator [Achromobacter insolitus]MCP1403587.1 DNA-binding transcriptional LysR family regulator [Achromobacter insolitus]MDH3064905.1 LysR family transcriptional regulator [Achromobacter insolitus]MDQ6215003.1 LysR family transcriptional regulator [Achromobacter insolitus]
MISLGLRYFLEVARCGSIAGAAAEQHVAASAISRQIAKLEDGLGIALFERQARGMELSEAGRQLAAYANAAALEAERVTTEIRQRSHLGDVTIRLACTEGFAHRFLPMCMAEFKQVRPEARFHLHVERPEEVSRQILEGLSQLALRYTTAQDDRLKTELLVRAPVYAVMCRHHPLAGRRSLSMRDLTKVPLSLGDHGTTVRQLFDAACANAGLHIEPAYVSNHSAAFLPMLPGSDIVALSGYLTLLGQRDGEALVAVPFSNPEMRQRSIQVLTLQGRTLPALAREFLEFMARRLTATPKAPEAEA